MLTISVLFITWNAIFIKAQMPLSLNAASGLFVKLHNISTAPENYIIRNTKTHK